MNEQEREPAIRRILVAVDASRHSLAALDAAVELAARLEAELLGLFVEDINLLRLAGLPFAREVHFPSAVARELDSPHLEQELRRQASRARRALMTAAEQTQIRWSFRVVRGQVTPEVLAAALDADLLTLGMASRPVTRRVRLGSTARTAAAKAPRSVLLLQHGLNVGLPVLVTFDGSAPARQALATAARLAETAKDGDGASLVVLLLGPAAEPDASRAAPVEQEIADFLSGRGLAVRFRRLPGAVAANLVEAVRRERGGLLVLGGEGSLLEEEAVQALLDEIDCPVLLVR